MVATCHDSFHLISFHLSLRVVSKCVFSCARISDKVPGKLGGASTGDTRLLQNLPGIMLPEAKFAQASRVRASIQNSPAEAESSEIARLHVQNSPVYRFFIPRFQRLIHDSCSPSNHVTAKHWEKQHHAVTSLFCRSLVACWTAGNSDAVVCFCQPSSIEIALNAVKLPLLFVGARKTPHLIGDTHDPCTQRFEHHVPCHNPALRETAPFRYQPCLSVVGCLLNSRKLWCSGLLLSAFFNWNCTERRETSFAFCWSKENTTPHWWHPRPMYTEIWAPRSMSQPSTEGNSAIPLPALFVGRWLLAEQPETLMQWFAVIGLFRETCAERRETSFGFMLEQATQRQRHLSTMFHVTTQHRGKQHATLRTIFLVRKIVPQRLAVCGKPSIKGSAGGQQPIFLCCATKLWKMWWKGSWTHEPVPALCMGSG